MEQNDVTYLKFCTLTVKVDIEVNLEDDLEPIVKFDSESESDFETKSEPEPAGKWNLKAKYLNFKLTLKYQKFKQTLNKRFNMTFE